MTRTTFWAVALWVAGWVWQAHIFAQEAALPPGDPSPRLRLETGGPRSYISGLAFSPDGGTLYATGWDKAVQVWNRNEQGEFEFSSAAALRVPTGAGNYGGLNSLAISADGEWLATAGLGYPQGISGERETGWVVPAGVMSEAAQLDEGLIYVFNTGTRTCRLLRGHRGPVQSLAFVQGSESAVPELVSVAEERSSAGSKLQPRVRFWDVSRGVEIGALSEVPGPDGKTKRPLPGLQGFRPGLAAWSVGSAPAQARVALAWGDNQFRIWDVDTGRVTAAPTEQNLLVVLPLGPSGTRLLTGAHAEVGVWSLPGDRSAALNRRQFRPASIDSVNGKSNNLPGVIALIPGSAGGEPRLAGIVTHYLSDGRGEYRALIASHDPVKTLRETPLDWTGEIRQPALAASADGQLLALAGNSRNEIEIHAIADLAAGKNVPRQRLASAGLSIRKVSFVRQGNDWGLRLTESAAGDAGREPRAVVTNFRARRVEPDSDAWQLASARAEGWTAVPSAPGTLTVRRPNLDPLVLKFEPDYVPTAFAYCPPSPHCEFPLLALALQQRGQPLLQIYRADTGEPVRWCVAHTEAIRSLSFSDDGRMLASAADDRTVCVWTVTDLTTRTIGRRGRLPDVIVQSRENRTVVSEAPSGFPLKVGDEITTVTRSGESVPVNSAREFYQFVLERLPGDTLEVAVLRDGRVQKVACDVAQAIDEAKPLFSLFVSPAVKPGEWQWIGWHPLGNFDAEGEDIDRWLGWHFNTGEAERPARFAPIGEYRDDFYRPHLLQGLIDDQKLVVEAVLEEPHLLSWLRYTDGSPVALNLESTPQVESAAVELVTEVTGVPERAMQGLELTVDDGPAVAMQHQGGREWTADLSQVNWRRGRHRLAVKLRTSDREIVDLLRVEYRPAAPQIGWTQTWPEEAKSNEVRIDAAVSASSEPAKVQLLLRPAGRDEPEVIGTWETDGTLQIEETVNLEPGENRIELVSWNLSAPDEERGRETVQVARLVRRAAAAQAPRVRLESVEAVSEGVEPVPLTPEANVFHSSAPTIRLRGTIGAQTPIERATIAVGETVRDLTRFQANQSEEFEFDETVTLAPGSQTVVVRTAIGDLADEKRLTLNFHPAAPFVIDLSLSPGVLKDLPSQVGSSADRLYAGYHESDVLVTATLGGGIDRPYGVELLVNDRPQPAERISIDRSQVVQHRLSARVPLSAGRNSIVLRVTNEWQREPVSRAVDVEYLQPPEFVTVDGPEVLVGEPLNLTCRIRSAIPLRTATITIDDTLAFRDFTIVPVEDSPGEWRLEARGIGLSAGEHRLVLTAANDDGPALEAAVHVVRMEQPRVQPPVLTLLSPSPGVSQNRALRQFEIQTSLVSEVPAELVIRMRGKTRDEEQRITTHPVDGSPATTAIELFDGTCDIELQAVNSGGFSEKQSFQVSYVPGAATVEIASIGDLRPRLRNDGSGSFDQPAAKAITSLEGRIVIHDREAVPGQLTARIWVNNYMLPTVPVVFDPAEPSIGRYRRNLVLSRRLRNQVRVEVFGSNGKAASEIGSTNILHIDCLAPQQDQDLYLLLLGDGDAKLIREGARAVLQVNSGSKRESSQEHWGSDAFANIYVHQAMNFTPMAVMQQLKHLVESMNRQQQQRVGGNTNAVVMIYYQGQITLLDDDFAFGPRVGGRSRNRITGKLLETELSASYGAHLLCLNLVQKEGDVIHSSHIWPKAPHLGIFVSNWKGAEAQPKETELMSVLERALPRTRLVRDLADQMDEQYTTAGQSYPGLIETLDLLSPVYDLRLGALE